MSLVTIRFDLDTGRCRRGLVPICISATDADGHRIAPRWIEAVIPVADYLRRLARERIGDIWRVSELAELSVHAQWRKHREDFGNYPHRRIAAYARWAARTFGAEALAVQWATLRSEDHRLVVPQYPLSLRQLEEFMAEQNLSLDHVTSVPLPPHATCSVRVSALKQHPIVMLRRVLTEYAAYLHSERNHPGREMSCSFLRRMTTSAAAVVLNAGTVWAVYGGTYPSAA